MKNTLRSNLKKITALIVAASMTLSQNVTVFADEEIVLDEEIVIDSTDDEEIIIDEIDVDETDNVIVEEEQMPALIDEASDSIVSEQKSIESISESDEMARERESMPASDIFCNKLLTYLSLKYPEIGIDLAYGAFGGPDTGDPNDRYDHTYNAHKMADQTDYSEIIIDGRDKFGNYPDLTKNMVQFKILGNFGGELASDGSGMARYSDQVKTLIIRNVDEIRNLYVPASVETLIIEDTTLNCYYYYKDSPGFQCGMIPGDLMGCENLKKLVLKNVKFGDNYKRGDAANLLPEITYDCPYETNYKLNLQNCRNLEELEIDVSFEGAEEVQLAIDGGTDNLFAKLTDDKCKINPAPGTGYQRVFLYANENSYLAKRYNSSETVEFKNKQFRLWLLEALGVDTNNDGVISQDEMNAIETLTINDQTAHSAPQTSLSAFEELADISQFQNLKTLEIDFYDPTSNSDKGYRHSLKGIDFPDTLENLSMKNIYWEKDTQTKSHDDADIRLTNLKTLELYNTDVNVGSGDSYFNHSTQIELEDTDGALRSVMIQQTDVEYIKLINNSGGKGIKDDDERQRIRFNAINCQNLKSVEFLGEGYAVEGSLDLTNDKELTHIGVPKSADDKSEWTIYGEFDSTYAPVNVVMNSCTMLGSDCKKIIIDYDFINGRSINVQTMDTSSFSDGSGGSGEHKLIIYRNPRIPGDTAGEVYISCDVDSWVYNHYENEDGFVIENRTSFPTIAAFANGQRMRTSGEGQHGSESIYTKDTDCWVERWDLVMAPGGYSNNFGNLEFYVVDNERDPKNEGAYVDTLRRVFYKGDVYVEWDKQNTADSIITLPTVEDNEKGGYKLNGTKLSSTGILGEVQIKLYVYNSEGVKSYIGFQDVKVFALPDSVELVNDGTKRGSGTKDDPFIVDKNEELKIKARLKVNGDVDSTNYALRDVYWRIKEYDETSKYTSDSDGYSLYTLDSATKAGINVVRGKLNDGETEAQYDKRLDGTGEGGQDATWYNHRRLTFDTAGSRFKVVAQSPYKYNDAVKSAEVYVQIAGADGVEVSNNGKLIQGAYGKDFVTITATGGKDVTVKIKNADRYKDCFVLEEQSLSTDTVSVWTLKINSDDVSKVKEIIDENGYIDLSISVDGTKYERRVTLSSVVPEEGSFVVGTIPDQTYTGKVIKPKLNVYYGSRLLVEGKDYSLSYGKNNTNVASRTDSAAPSVTIIGKGNYSEKHTVYFSIVPADLSDVTVDDIVLNETGKDIKISPAISLEGKKIKAGTDYVISASVAGDNPITKLKNAGKYNLYVVGIGNYVGNKPFRVIITSDVLASKVTIPKIPNQNYDNGKSIEPEVTITYKGQPVNDCFDVEFQDNRNVGTATAIITAKDGSGFAGTRKLTFKITGTMISSAKLGLDGKGKIADVTYTGKSHKPTLDLYNGNTALIQGVDYSVEYSNNIAAGKATVIVKGKGAYTGSKKLSFKINPYNVEKDESLLFSANDGNPLVAAYEKGGAMPYMKIALGDKVLRESKDYTIKYANNNAVADLTADKVPTAIITFKGNYSGKRTVTFTVTTKDIGECDLSIADMIVNEKINGWKQTKFTITDTNGKKLSAGKDYDKNIKYYSNEECTVEIDAETLIAGTVVYVQIKGLNYYDGSTLTGSYRISKMDISKAVASVADQAYTGRAICPDISEVHVTEGKDGKTLVAGIDYIIVPGSYKNNIDKGTATLTIRGMGDYCGTKDVKFKIGTRQFLL